MFTEVSCLSSCLSTFNCTMIEILIYLLLGALRVCLQVCSELVEAVYWSHPLFLFFMAWDFESPIIVLMAIGTSLASIFFSAISSALSHHNKKSVEWSLVTPLSLGMILGAIVGAGYAATLSNEYLKMDNYNFLNCYWHRNDLRTNTKLSKKRQKTYFL